jgi:MYXO-CTERM domain-containing protein
VFALIAAGVAVFRLSEVVTASPTDDPAARYVELEVFGDGCLFPSTVLRAFDGGGAAVGEVAPFASTTCVTAGTYRCSRPRRRRRVHDRCRRRQRAAAGGGRAGVPDQLDHPLRLRAGADLTAVTISSAPTTPAPSSRPAASRWPASPTSTSSRPTGGSRLTPRAQRRHAVEPGDAGVDAAIDAGDGDAGIDGPPPPIDAPFMVDAAHIDANDRFLDLDPGGGAACGCGTSGGGGSALLAALTLAGLLARQRRRWSRTWPRSS